jgi:preprotein translocase subunit SecY
MVFVNALKEKRTAKKLGYTVLTVLVAMTLAQIPVIGISKTYMSLFFSKTNILGFMDALSGGSMSKMSVGGFGITSYITASIIIQLLSVIFPKLEKARTDGESGRKKFEKAEFIMAMIIALVSSILVSIGFGNSGLFVSFTPASVAVAVAEWMIGAFIIIYMAVKVEDYGIGNGPTLVLGCNILSRLPSNVISYFRQYVLVKNAGKGILYGCGLALAAVAVFTVAVYLQKGIINIPIKITRKKASVVNSDGHIPVSVNIANVLPVIYASTLISFPLVIITFAGITPKGNLKTFTDALSSANWYAPKNWTHVVGLVVYLLFIILFSYYSTMLTFSPEEIADNMKKSGDVIPGVNPGKDTISYLLKRRRTVTTVSIAFLLAIVVLPDAIGVWLGISNFTFMGTSLIIVISMISDTYLRMKAATIHNEKSFRMFEYPAENAGNTKGGKEKGKCLLRKTRA